MANPNEVFQNCMEPFFLEDAAPYLYNSDEESKRIFKHENGVWKVNTECTFFLDQPHMRWALERIIHVFLSEWESGDQFSKDDYKKVERMRAIIRERLEIRIERTINGQLLTIISAISGEKYESKVADSFYLTIFPRSMTEPLLSGQGLTAVEPMMWIPFEHSQVHAIRKQLTISKRESLAVCYITASERDNYYRKYAQASYVTKEGRDNFLPKEDTYYVIGTAKEDLFLKYPVFKFIGHMQWDFCIPRVVPTNPDEVPRVEQTCVLRFRRGQYVLPDLNKTEYEKTLVRQYFADTPEAGQKIPGLLEIARKEIEHGGMIVLADELVLKTEVDRLCRKHNRGYSLRIPVDLIKNSDSIKRFSEIDGALFVDLEGKCHAYGVMVDGTAVARGKLSRGARHNSAYNYCATQPDKRMMIFLKSEDGMTELISNKERS